MRGWCEGIRGILCKGIWLSFGTGLGGMGLGVTMVSARVVSLWVAIPRELLRNTLPKSGVGIWCEELGLFVEGVGLKDLEGGEGSCC